MRKLILIILISVLVFGCKKDEQQDPVVNQQEISFSADLIDPGAGLKDWECKTDALGDLLEPDYAKVVIGGVTYWPQVFRIDGVLYTQNIKLDVPSGNSATYDLTEFVLYDDGGTTEASLPGTDDQIVMGTPAMNSPYEVYITEALQFEYELTVTAFEKAQYEVEVLCFQDDEWDKFGFDWFVIDEIVIRQQCFFGDFCIKHIADYAQSNYALQSTGVQLDMPAIMELHVKDASGNHVPGSPFTNNTADQDYGVGAPLCIEYPDNLNIPNEEFTVELWIYVRQGDGFIFKHFHTWTFMDEQMIPDGEDGIVEYVLGSCNYTGTDLQLAPYQNLPEYANILIQYPGDPGYWGLTVQSVTPAGTYDLPVGQLLTAWCGDAYHQIPPGYHNVNVYTSLYDNDWPEDMPFDKQTIAKVNWIMNNLDNYGMSISTLTNAQGDIIQDAIWELINGITATGVAHDMATDAGSHGDYVPLPGGWAAVLFIKNDMPMYYQLIFTMVDP